MEEIIEQKVWRIESGWMRVDIPANDIETAIKEFKEMQDGLYKGAVKYSEYPIVAAGLSCTLYGKNLLHGNKLGG